MEDVDQGQPSYDILLRMWLSTAVIRASVAWALAITMFPRAISAQATVLKQGATVRFRLGADDPYRMGQLSRLTADSLIMERCATCEHRMRYARAELTRLDVSRRVAAGSRVMKGVLLGGLIGLVTGTASASTCHGGPECDLAGLAVPFGALLGGAVGGISAYLSSYIWDPVPATASSQQSERLM